MLATSKRNEILGFSPFAPSLRPSAIENSIQFSKKYANLFYYIDKVTDPTLTKLSFGASREEYVLVKCIIDNKEITESRILSIGFEAELVSMDVDGNDYLVFLTSDNCIHTLKNQN